MAAARARTKKGGPTMEPIAGPLSKRAHFSVATLPLAWSLTLPPR